MSGPSRTSSQRLCTRPSSTSPRAIGFTIGDQLWRAALSVPCNIVEGYSRDSAKQLLYHVNVAFASLNEALYVIDLATRVGAIDGRVASSAVNLGVQLQPRLAAFARTIRNGNSRHSRFPPAPLHQRP